MGLRMEDVNVVLLANACGLDEDEVRAAFGVYSADDREILNELARTKDFPKVLELYRQSQPDTAKVKHQLAQALVDLALLPDQLWEVLNSIVNDQQITEQAWSRLLTMTQEQDDLVEIASQSSSVELVDQAIRRLAEFYKKQ